MKTFFKFYFAVQFIVLCLISCTSNNPNVQKEIELLQKENQELKETIELLKKESQELKKTIELLKYSSADRLANINKLILENKFDESITELEKLQELFPLSKEAEKVDSFKKTISEKQEKTRKEEERIKALGFKALKEENSVQIDYNKISIGSLSIAQTFTYDSYGNRYFYSAADRGNKYISSRISIISTSKNPDLPSFYAYSVKGDKLEYIGNFYLKFEKWRDYGAYLGNYNDNGNDFSKTATIAFKIGVEVSDEAIKEPLVILLKKENCMVREYDKFANPPVSYSNSLCRVPKILTIEDVNNDYVVVKFYNKNKL